MRAAARGRRGPRAEARLGVHVQGQRRAGPGTARRAAEQQPLPRHAMRTTLTTRRRAVRLGVGLAGEEPAGEEPARRGLRQEGGARQGREETVRGGKGRPGGMPLTVTSASLTSYRLVLPSLACLLALSPCDNSRGGGDWEGEPRDMPPASIPPRPVR